MGASTAVAPPKGAELADGDRSTRHDRSGDRDRSTDRDHPPTSARVRRIDAGVAQEVEVRLERVLADRVAQATDVDATFGADIAERVARFTLGGGRRMRPQFLWWGLRACGLPDDEQIDAALRLGTALELIQTCALVHDDVMDQAPTRRGRPALHTDCATQYASSSPAGARDERFGESAAILAGDLALAWADDTAAALLLPPWQAERIRDAWSRMRLEMVAGQYLDIHGELTRSRSLSRAISAACLKTALYTVERPLQLGAILGNANDTVLRALCSAGRCAGLAFQLRDDLDDVFVGSAPRSKPAGGDLRTGKPTYLVALAHARAEADGDRQALHLLNHRLGRPDLDENDLGALRHVLERTGARRNVEDKIHRLLAQSTRHLHAAPLDPVALTRLQTLMHRAAGMPARAGDTLSGLPAAEAWGAAR
ncbi:polyprenyl synthetase family protein [Streptomyces sp. VRA16 Mangrove soil]|nr:polyprenyl synthetase family protein [Streptomyces sp. VRA16 Mangrove soil]